MSNRTAAARRKLSQLPPGDYSHCASSRLHPRGINRAILRVLAKQMAKADARAAQPLAPQKLVGS